MKGLFDVTKIMFEYPEKWNDVTAGEKYATKIEVGGPNSRAFPFFEPALIGTAPAVIELFALAVKKVIK